MTGPRRAAGLTYMEVLVAIALMAAALTPALDALYAGHRAGAEHQALAVRQHRLYGKLEEVLAQSHGALDAAALAAGGPGVPTGFSDPPGTADRLLVYLARYDGDDADADGDPFTGGDAGLIWVQVAVEGTALSVQSLHGR